MTLAAELVPGQPRILAPSGVSQPRVDSPRWTAPGFDILKFVAVRTHRAPVVQIVCLVWYNDNLWSKSTQHVPAAFKSPPGCGFCVLCEFINVFKKTVILPVHVAGIWWYSSEINHSSIPFDFYSILYMGTKRVARVLEGWVILYAAVEIINTSRSTILSWLKWTEGLDEKSSRCREAVYSKILWRICLMYAQTFKLYYLLPCTMKKVIGKRIWGF